MDTSNMMLTTRMLLNIAVNTYQDNAREAILADDYDMWCYWTRNIADAYEWTTWQNPNVPYSALIWGIPVIDDPDGYVGWRNIISV